MSVTSDSTIQGMFACHTSRNPLCSSLQFRSSPLILRTAEAKDRPKNNSQ
jgi:hypothetical protein